MCDHERISRYEWILVEWLLPLILLLLSLVLLLTHDIIEAILIEHVGVHLILPRSYTSYSFLKPDLLWWLLDSHLVSLKHLLISGILSFDYLLVSCRICLWLGSLNAVMTIPHHPTFHQTMSHFHKSVNVIIHHFCFHFMHHSLLVQHHLHLHFFLNVHSSSTHSLWIIILRNLIGWYTRWIVHLRVLEKSLELIEALASFKVHSDKLAFKQVVKLVELMNVLLLKFFGHQLVSTEKHREVPFKRSLDTFLSFVKEAEDLTYLLLQMKSYILRFLPPYNLVLE